MLMILKFRLPESNVLSNWWSWLWEKDVHRPEIERDTTEKSHHP